MYILDNIGYIYSTDKCCFSSKYKSESSLSHL